MESKHHTIEFNHPNNEKWETLDYSEPNNRNLITLIITSGKASQETINRILETANVDTTLLDTSYHEYAHVENLIQTIQRVKKHVLAPYQRRIVNRLIESFFIQEAWEYNKHQEFMEYLKTNYDVDIKTMPTELIKQMLQIEDMDDGYPSNSNMIHPI
jgi:hypothetical protein